MRFIFKRLRLGMCCHGIFQAGFQSMFSKNDSKGHKKERPLGEILRVLSLDDGDGNDDVGRVAHQSPESPFVFPDISVQRIQGVRASKSQTWLSRTTTVSELVTAIETTEPIFRLSTWFLQQQEDQLWLSQDPTLRPVVSLVTPRFSPVVRAMAQCFSMLQDPWNAEHGPLHLLDRSWSLNMRTMLQNIRQDMAL